MSGPDALPPAGVPPEEAIRFFRSKGYRIGFNWQDVFKLEHIRWFTVAKATSRSVLEDIREAVDAAISDGTTLAEFKATLRPKLEAKGWWGRKAMIDPLTTETKVVQLGSPARLKTIFNANLRTAYQAGKWERIQRTKVAFPYLEYDCVMDGRERQQHHDWNGTLLPADDPWWDTHYGPCDWNCRCTAKQRSRAMIERLGLTVTETPIAFPQEPWVNTRTGETGTTEAGIGKGWDYNVGKEYLRALAPSPLPESFSGDADEVGAAAAGEQFRTGQLASVDGFLAHFGIAPGNEAIWLDRDGWPLSIGRAWFLGDNGDVRLPRGAAGVLLDRIAAAIVTPDAIRWVWVRGDDGRALLFRRYTRSSAGLTTTVDVGGVGWRWNVAPAEAVAAGYNPRQPRDRFGRFASRRAASMQFVKDALAHTNPGERFDLGRLSPEAATRLAALGAPTIRGGKLLPIHLEASSVQHIHRRHGNDRPPQKPITASDYGMAARLLNTGRLSRGTPKFVNGAHVIVAEANIDSDRMRGVFHVGNRRITLYTMRKR